MCYCCLQTCQFGRQLVLFSGYCVHLYDESHAMTMRSVKVQGVSGNGSSVPVQ
jgi:hypothetical protein